MLLIFVLQYNWSLQNYVTYSYCTKHDEEVSRHNSTVSDTSIYMQFHAVPIQISSPAIWYSKPTECAIMGASVNVLCLGCCRCSPWLFLNDAEVMKSLALQCQLGFLENGQRRRVLESGNTVGEGWWSWQYWPEISAQTKESEQEHCYCVDNFSGCFHCTPGTWLVCCTLSMHWEAWCFVSWTTSKVSVNTCAKFEAEFGTQNAVTFQNMLIHSDAKCNFKSAVYDCRFSSTFM